MGGHKKRITRPCSRPPSAHCRAGRCRRCLSSLQLPVEPAAAVERELACGSMYSLSNDDGNLVLVVRDHDGEVLAPVLSAGEAEQLRRDLSRVLMASREAA